MSGPGATVGHGVVVEMIRLAALEVPGVARVGRGGPPWRGLLAGRAITARVRDSRVEVRLWIVARPGHALEPLASQVRSAVAAAVERLLGLELAGVTVLIDGVGG
ncbi:MAG: Asp23/Gls24 family envelope stress response protein [Chloroflexota bacterium]